MNMVMETPADPKTLGFQQTDEQLDWLNAWSGQSETNLALVTAPDAVYRKGDLILVFRRGRYSLYAPKVTCHKRIASGARLSWIKRAMDKYKPYNPKPRKFNARAEKGDVEFFTGYDKSGKKKRVPCVVLGRQAMSATVTGLAVRRGNSFFPNIETPDAEVWFIIFTQMGRGRVNHYIATRDGKTYFPIVGKKITHGRTRRAIHCRQEFPYHIADLGQTALSTKHGRLIRQLIHEWGKINLA
jgi:hypothetical protein